MLYHSRRDQLLAAIQGLKALGPNDPVGLAGLGAVQVALRSEIDEAKEFSARIEKTPEAKRSLAAHANLLGTKARITALACLQLKAMDGLDEFVELSRAAAEKAEAEYLAFKDENLDAMVEEEEQYVGACESAQAAYEEHEAYGSYDD